MPDNVTAFDIYNTPAKMELVFLLYRLGYAGTWGFRDMTTPAQLITSRAEISAEVKKTGGSLASHPLSHLLW